MPSPFPGMDPFIESQKWLGFHTQFIPAIGQALVQRVRPRYQVDFEEYVYLCEQGSDDEVAIAPDVWVSETEEVAALRPAPEGTAAVAVPVILTMSSTRRIRQPYLLIKTRDGRDVVTVIELLSPWNKRPIEGRTEYLSKRHNLMRTGAQLVELDLLRGGARLPTRESLPVADYFVYVTRRELRPKIEVYPWTLRERMPVIPVPLASEEQVLLDLQSAFTDVYDRAGYDYALDYRRPLSPVASEADMAWIAECLASRPVRGNG